METPQQCRRANLEDPLLGTASQSQHLVIVDQPRPWKSKIQESLSLAPDTQALLDSWREAGESFTLLASANGNQAVHRFSWPLDVSSFQEPIWLVCTHGSRDSCCGTLGIRLAKQLRELNIGQVWEVSHIGGHRFAPTLWHLPSWRVYGRLPEEADALANWATRPLTTEFLRGHAGYSAKLQVFEAYLFDQTGTWPMQLSSKSDEIVVQWTDGSQRWRVDFLEREHSGFQSCRDIPVGKTASWVSYSVGQAAPI